MGYKALEDGRLNFYVKDTGQGIAEEQLQTSLTALLKSMTMWKVLAWDLLYAKGLLLKWEARSV